MERHPATDFAALQREITRDNAISLLGGVACPHCLAVGNYLLFEEIANNGIGIKCRQCETHHPFVKQRIMWLRGEHKRRPNDIVTVAKQCGAYCYNCGSTFAELEALGIALCVHHTRAFAEHGEVYAKVPYCTECHELANFMQRARQRQLKRGKSQ